jgi:hypothetical protein
VNSKSKNQEPLEIFQHHYKHKAGIAYFYENKTENKTLQEILTFKLTNLEIVGSPGLSEVKVVLKPG